MILKICGEEEAWSEIVYPTVDWTHFISIGAPPHSAASELRDKANDPQGLFPGFLLKLRFEDIPKPYPGYQEPRACDIAHVIDFARLINETSSVLVHCAAGVSRSPAVAFVLLCAYLGPGYEAEAYHRVKTVRPHMFPNPLIVRLGDELLGRNGLMMETINEHRVMDNKLPINFTEVCA